MLEISQAIEYGVRGIIHMAQQGSDKSFLLKDIAEAEDISPTFLHKIFHRLTRTRILNSRRGVGYTLARPPEEISVLDIAEAIEGPLMLRRCIMDKDYCDRGEHCLLASFWLELQNDMAAKLGSVSIKDLLGSAKGAPNA